MRWRTRRMKLRKRAKLWRRLGVGRCGGKISDTGARDEICTRAGSDGDPAGRPIGATVSNLVGIPCSGLNDPHELMAERAAVQVLREPPAPAPIPPAAAARRVRPSIRLSAHISSRAIAREVSALCASIPTPARRTPCRTSALPPVDHRRRSIAFAGGRYSPASAAGQARTSSRMSRSTPPARLSWPARADRRNMRPRRSGSTPVALGGAAELGYWEQQIQASNSDYAWTSANLRRRYGIGGVRRATKPSRGIMAARSYRRLKRYSNSAR